MRETLKVALSGMRLIPALRGLPTKEALGVAETLVGLGATVLEIPLRTKDPAFSPIDAEALGSLKLLVAAFDSRVTIVAGTVMNVSDLEIVQDLGVHTCLSLNLQTDLVERAVERGMAFIPGVETITEAIAATKAGAAGLKLFPAVIREPDGGTSVRVTPGFVAYLCRFLSIPIIPAGNSFENGIAAAYLRSGALAVNVGAQLYEPGISLGALQERFNLLASECATTSLNH